MKLILLLVTFFLLMLVIEKVYEWCWFRKLKVQIRFQEHPAIEGEQAMLTEMIWNHKWLPLTMLQIEFLVENGLGLGTEENVAKSDRQYKRDIFAVSYYQKISRKIPFRCLKRGYYSIDCANVSTRDPRMKMTFYEEIPQDTALYVYPQKLHSNKTELVLKKLNGILERRKSMQEDPFAFAGIREYDPSDSMNTINWKASARSESLMVNTRNSTYSAKAICFLDVKNDVPWKDEQIHEEEIRLTLTVIDALAKDAIPVSLISNGLDCLNLKEIRVPYGDGKGQVEKISRSLSRLQFEKQEQIRTLYTLLKEKKQEILSEQPVVVLISENTEQKLLNIVEEFQKQGVTVFWTGTLSGEEFLNRAGRNRAIYTQWR